MRRFVLVALLALGVTASLLAQADGPDQNKIDADKHYNEGNSLLKSGKYAEAVTKYNAAIALSPDDYKYFYQKGLALKNSKNPTDAIEAFKKSVDLKGDFYLTYYALGLTYHSMKDHDDAITAFKNCLQIQKNFDKAWLGLAAANTSKGNDLVARGKIDEAIQILQDAVAAQKDYAPAYALLARSLNLASRYEEAVAASMSAIDYKRKGKKGAEYFELGIAYKKLGDITKARQAFIEARKDANYVRNAQYELDGLR